MTPSLKKQGIVWRSNPIEKLNIWAVINKDHISPWMAVVLMQIPTNHHTRFTLYCTIGWSDLALFRNFRKVTRFCWSGIFFWGQFQKIGKFRWARSHIARAAKSSCSKNPRDLKNEYIFIKICRILPYTSKNNRQEENSKLKVV